VAEQAEFAKALDRSIQAIDKTSYDFVVAGASREDAEVIVVFVGFTSAGVVAKVGRQLSETTKPFVKSATTYLLKLEKQY
jgi:pyruvate/2-oxoacid:ferredoxin oxidoreductase alpha subunit